MGWLMALHRYSRVRGLTGEVTADVRESGVSGFDDRKRVVDLSVEGDCQLLPQDWDKLVAEVNTLLGRDEGSVVPPRDPGKPDDAAGGS